MDFLDTKPNGVFIIESILEGPVQFKHPNGVILINDQLTEVQRARIQADKQAKSYIYQSLPDEIFSAFNHDHNAKEIWDDLTKFADSEDFKYLMTSTTNSSQTTSQETTSVVDFISKDDFLSPPPKTTTLRSSSSPKTPSPQRPSSPSSPKSPQIHQTPIHQSSPLPEIISPVPLTMEQTQPQTIVSQMHSSSSFPRSPPPTYFHSQMKSIPVNIRKTFKRSQFEYDRFQTTEQEDANDSSVDESDSDDANITPLRTPMTPIVIPFAHLSDATGTNIERLAIVPFRGLFGSPSLANITPALTEGALVARTVVRQSEFLRAQSVVCSSCFRLNGNPKTVMMSLGHSVESLETTDVPDSAIPLLVEAQRLISQFVEGIEEGQRSELIVSRNIITGKLPAIKSSSPSPRLLTGDALHIDTPVASSLPPRVTQTTTTIPTTMQTTTTIPSSTIQTTPIIPTIPPTTTPSPITQSFPDPSSPHHSSSSSSESSDSAEYLSDCSPRRIATSGLSTDTLVVALMHRLRSEEPHLTSHKRSIFQSLLAYMSFQDSNDLPPLVRQISHYYSTTSTSNEPSDHDPFQPEDDESDSSDSDDPDNAQTSEQSQQETYGKDIFEDIVYHLKNPENLETPSELAQGDRHP
uniref:flocculation protein FLO11-like n=1 Tax=Erigeron canadensis TaxID=72917 RepID=UPI001CB8B219|nr:flocculation protein FLO11-like [Erigeron canadensis]